MNAKVYLEPGDIIRNHTLGFSEVLCYMKIAGQQKDIEILSKWSAQILREDGTPDGAPILTGEAGFYADDKGYYYTA